MKRLIFYILLVILIFISLYQTIKLFANGTEIYYIACLDGFPKNYNTTLKKYINEYCESYGINRIKNFNVNVEYYDTINSAVVLKNISIRHSNDKPFWDTNNLIFNNTNINKYYQIPDNTILINDITMYGVQANGIVLTDGNQKTISIAGINYFHYTTDNNYNPYNLIGYTNDSTFLGLYNNKNNSTLKNMNEIPDTYYECRIKYTNKFQLIRMFIHIKTKSRINIQIYRKDKLLDIIILFSLPFSLLFYIIIICTVKSFTKR